MLNIKLFLLVAIALLSSYVIKAQDISENTARKIASNFLKLKSIDPLKKSNKELNLINITPLINKKYNGFYLFKIADGNGFCIVSAESASHPILAYSTNSNIKISKNISPEFLSILNNYQANSEKSRRNYLKKSVDKNSELIKKEWEELLSDNYNSNSKILTNRVSTNSSMPIKIEPLIKTNWDQSPLYNKYTPFTYESEPTFTGSAATAMAQIMKFWNYPSTGRDSITYQIPSSYFYYFYNWRWKKLSANFQKTTYQWNKMPIALSNYSSDEQIDAVATLMSHAGISVEMVYGPVGSGAFSEKVPNALKKYFKYSPDVQLKDRSNYNSDEEWLNLIKGQISKGYPVYFSSICPDAEHAYIADGYDERNLVHLNLGWSGEANGYYLINELRGYSSSQLVVINIYPSEFNCTAPSGFSTSDTSTNSATLTWNSDNNDQFYKIQFKIKNDSLWTVASEKTKGSSFVLSNLNANTQYIAQIKAICDTIHSVSSNFIETSFQTKSIATPPQISCINNFEPNNSFDEAHLIKVDSTYQAGIGTSTDVDYYKFIITKNSNIVISLKNLKKDYDLKLYNNNKDEIGQGIAGNTTEENIKVDNILPGTYYIKVYGYEGAFDTSTCYELKVNSSFSSPSCSNNYEPNESFEEAYPISTYTTYYAGIGSANDQDYYKFTINETTDVSISLQNANFINEFTLYNSSKNVIANDTSDDINKVINAKDLASGTYYIHIKGNLYPYECYSLFVDTQTSRNSCINNYESNDSFDNAIDIKVGNVYSAGISTSNDLDYYKFSIDNKSNVTVSLQNIFANYELKIFNSSKTEIGSKYNEDKSDEIITINDLEPGIYYVLIQGVNGAFNASQCYSLLVNAISSVTSCINNYESNDSFDEAHLIKVDSTYQAGIGTPTDKDYYKFTIQESSDLVIQLQNLPKNYDLKLYDNLGYEIDKSTNKGNISEKIEAKNLPAGDYYVYVYGYNGAFDTENCYTLNVGASTAKSLCSNNYEPNDSFESAYPIRNILTYSSGISSPEDHDYYKFYIGINADVRIILENLPYDYDLKLYDSSKIEIGSSSNNNTNKEIINAKNLKPGVYYVHVYAKDKSFDPTKCYDLSVNYQPAQKDINGNTENSVILYPNPVQDIINLKNLDGLNIDKGKITTFTILDRNGRTVKILPIKAENEITINVSDLPPNHYILQINGQNYRFIKK
ncbi:C10 family peptidase [uncultured Apibacter sp.]|uniref:C10 family peptidase n=1 Tax=uncultured Apibacter sp. TaxID=1778616 RepID=UPI0025E45A96|nr:C10 family peptidase [uncultured Apibacter sp.]